MDSEFELIKLDTITCGPLHELWLMLSTPKGGREAVRE
jgi:hypothetical protein